VKLAGVHVAGVRLPPLRTGLAVSLLLGTLLSAAVVHAADEPRILTPAPSSFETLTRFTALLEALQKTYAQPSRINTDWYMTVALRGFVRSIDPEADLLTSAEAALTNESTETAADIGLSFAIRDDFPTIISARDGSPAQSADLLPGEQILAIGDISTSHARRLEVDRFLRGAPNTPVSLRIIDPGTGAIRDVRLRRTASAPPPGAALRVLDNGIAYYRISEFTPGAVENLRSAMTFAKSQRVPGIILDLRNNPGGAFLTAQAAASFFLPKGADVVSLAYANPAGRATFPSDESLNVTVPLVLLVNGGTAAEAEVFAAALQDNQRARIVGSKTFGRGFLTTSTRLSDGSTLVTPTAYYLRPSNQLLQDKGLTPDVIVELPRETERALARAGFGAFDWKNNQTGVLATDLPLAKALSLLTK
jgi:carboxyl-terminal processing protease